jgi:hypothetical protein
VPNAQYNLGVMHLDGQGAAQVDAEALYWFRKAAAQGQHDAMTNLGAMYGAGRGVPRDLVRAHMWSSLAAAAGAGEDAEALRADIAGKVGDAELAEAERLAQACLASGYAQCGEPDDEGD